MSQQKTVHLGDDDEKHIITTRCKKGMSVHLGPSETAMIAAAAGATLKLFHLVVPQIPR